MKENVKGCGIKTKVRGIRATEGFWNKVQETAELNDTDVNKLVVYVVNKYCNRVLTSKKSCDKL